MSAQLCGGAQWVARKLAAERGAVSEQKTQRGAARPAEGGTAFFYSDQGLFRYTQLVRHVVLCQSRLGAQQAQTPVAGGDQRVTVRFYSLLSSLSDTYLV